MFNKKVNILNISILILTIFPASFFNELKLLIFLLMVLNIIIRNKKYKINKKNLFYISFMFLFFIFSFYLSLFYDFNKIEYAMRALISNIILLFITTLLLKYFYINNNIEYSKIFNIFIIGLSIYSIIKLIFIFMPFITGLNVRNVSNILKANFVIDYRSENQQYLRIATSNDLMLPFGLFILLHDEYFNLKYKRIKKILLSLLFIITMILTFTRLIWFFLFIILLFYFIHIKLYKNIIFMLFFTFIFIYSISIKDRFIFFPEIIIRFNDITSLNIKSTQAYLLLICFLNKPLLGHGIGSYLDEYIRSKTLPFIYEVQWASFLYQYGAIGTFFIILIVMIPIYKTIIYFIKNKVITYYTFILLLIYFMFLLSGFTNPNLTNLNTSMIYFITYLLSNYVIIRSSLLSAKTCG